MRIRWIRTPYCSRPKPRDYCELSPDVGAEIRALGCHGRRHFDDWVKIPNPSLGLLPHPLAVVAHINREGLRAVPFTSKQRLLVSRLRVYRRPPTESSGYVDHCLIDEYGDRVEVTSVSLE